MPTNETEHVVIATLPALIDRKLQDHNLSIRDAAWQAGVSHSVLARASHGERVSLDNTIALYRWCGYELIIVPATGSPSSPFRLRT